MDILLEREIRGTVCTLGRFYCCFFSCASLELPWLGNLHDVSCIPCGRYKLAVIISPRLGILVIAVRDVPDRSNIEIHPLNFPHESKGCIGPGLTRTDTAIGFSKGAFDCLMALVQDAERRKEECWLEVRDIDATSDSGTSARA